MSLQEQIKQMNHLPFVENCPRGEPINGDDKCEAYNLGKCNVSGRYCTKYDEGGKKK